ncbi:MAG: cardiolipin synthase [Eubacteriaceae bacterium]|nr:cardiolipin synthase [Eubacteriaceae bacterium]
MISTGAVGMGILYLINFITIIIIIFFSRKDMSTTFAWLLLLVFLPIIGFLFYFFLGSTKKLELMTKKYSLAEAEEEYEMAVHEAARELESGREAFVDPYTANYKDMILANVENAKAIYTEDNDVQLLINGQGKFPRMFEEIEKAEHNINVMYFIYKTKDEIGRQFTRLLIKKAKEGVEVRLLYDGLGCLKTKIGDFAELEKAGGHVQRFLPSMLKTILQANYRLHRKMVVIDGRVGYTGGINVGDDYLGKYPKISPWRDTSVRVTGRAVWELQLLFFKDWTFCSKQNRKYRNSTYLEEFRDREDKFFPPKLTGEGNMGVQIIQCGPDAKYQVHKDNYVKICNSAKKYLYIQSPYFVPDQTLLDSIRLAAQSGVDVRMMIPGIADKKAVYNVAMSYVEELLEAGVKIYKYRGFIHSKTMVTDNFIATVGTTNLDIRSFKLDWEVNTLVYDRDFAVTCRDTFMNDIDDCDEIIYDEFMKRGRWQYFKESICRFISPLS